MADEATTVETVNDENFNEDALLQKSILLEKDQKIAEQAQIIAEKDQKIAKMTNRSLKVHEKNQMLMASEDVQQRLALLEYEQKVMDMELKMAEKFASSKAFPTNTPEQCYVLMQAGKEMGLSPIISLNMLYVVNGHINPYGDKMVGYVLRHGYNIQYLDEDVDHTNTNHVSTVTVRIFKEDEEYIETAKSTDQIIIKSLVKGAASFALKNKLRFHAIRMICSFHLPHLFMGCSDAFTLDFEEWKDGEEMKLKDSSGHTIVMTSNDEIQKMISEAKDEDALAAVESVHGLAIKKDINLVTALGAAKKRLKI